MAASRVAGNVLRAQWKGPIRESSRLSVPDQAVPLDNCSDRALESASIGGRPHGLIAVLSRQLGPLPHLHKWQLLRLLVA
jgi:hypothetical protein